MIDQMWSPKLCTKVQEWEQAFSTWGMEQPDGFADPIAWIKENGFPSSDPQIAAAYAEMQQENRRKSPALRAAYDKINPCPVRRYSK